MGLRELSHLSYGAISVSVVIFLRAGRPFPLASRFLAIFQTADAARNIKFYFASPEHTLTGRGGRWTRNFSGGYGRPTHD